MRRHLAVLSPLALAAGLALPAHAAPEAKPDAKLLAAAEAARPEQLKLLQEVVNLDSGTGDAAGGDKVAAVLAKRLEALGAKIETAPAEEAGLPANTVATLTGKGKGRILLIGHLDTVFGPGTAAKRPFHTDATKAYGPGVSDEKGGVVEGVTALKLLHDLKRDNYSKIVFLIETSEERGSPGTRRLIERLLKDADVEFNLEPGDSPDVLTVWRKGSATFHIKVHGRAAHAGVTPQDGRNAAVELIHQILAMSDLPRAGDGLTANLTVLRAGERANIIPDEAEAQINVRVRDAADFDKVEAKLRGDAAKITVPDTTVEVYREPAFPPLADNAATFALATKAKTIYGELGKTITEGGNGGASESALAAAAGVPALDGLGPVGGGFHSDKEFLVLDTVTPRTYLLTRLILETGAHPPKPSASKPISPKP
ncbi:MAG: glutamate carboxypeptidase [Pseudomonadota bacterium]|jgi:glutamate carboxypeptidase